MVELVAIWPRWPDVQLPSLTFPTCLHATTSVKLYLVPFLEMNRAPWRVIQSHGSISSSWTWDSCGWKHRHRTTGAVLNVGVPEEPDVRPQVRFCESRGTARSPGYSTA